VNPFSPEPVSKKRRQLRIPLAYDEEKENKRVPRYVSDFQELKKLGEGSFGIVCRVRNRLDGCIYAVKKTKMPFRSKREREELLREAYALAAIGSHPHIMRYYSVWTEYNHIYLQTECCDGGSLKSCIRRGRIFEERELLVLLKHIGSALNHMHARSLAHLDVKPENLYIRRADHENGKGKPSNMEFVLGDFSLIFNFTSDVGPDFVEGDGRFVSKKKKNDSLAYSLFRYLPSEILNANAEDETNKTNFPKADIYSLACSLVEVALCKEFKLGDEVHRALRNGNVNLPRYSKSLKNLLDMMLHPNPLHRLSAQELLVHPLISSLDDTIDLDELNFCDKLMKDLKEARQLIRQLQNG